jgi:hypothetical protein
MQPVIVDQVPATNQFHFLSGIYDRSSHKIPYLSMTMSFLDAANSLKLASEMPGAEEVEWEIEELYQRDIDWVRVRDRIVPYLNNNDAPNFFNAITIAALPLDAANHQLAQSFADDLGWNPPGLIAPEQFPKVLNVGPVSLGYYGDFQSVNEPAAQLGAVRWNPTQVFGVAIDGQHRLAAIKSLVSKNAADPRHLSTKVPVLILLLDERVGYRAPEGTRNVEVVRRLFIDLNKHAQSVKRARQVLLDDHEPHSISVRRLIGTKLTPDLADLNLEQPRLPLSLVDWFTEQAKFEKGPFLTTVLGLDWLATRVLNTKPIGDYTAYNSVKKQLTAIENSLGIRLLDAKERLKELSNIKLSPFEYSNEDLAAVSEGFASVWSSPIVSAFTKFAPYASLIQRRVEDGSISLEFQDWYRLWIRGGSDAANSHHREEYLNFVERMSLPRPGHKPIRAEDMLSDYNAILDVKAGTGLAFYVVFQKALLSALISYCRLPISVFDDLVEADWDVDFELDEEAELDAADEAVDDEGDAEEDFERVPSDSMASESSAGDLASDPETDAARGNFGVDSAVIAEMMAVDHEILKVRIAERSAEFIDLMNRVVAGWPEFLELSSTVDSDRKGSDIFWQGSLRKAEGEIDFTQAAEGRAKVLIALVAAMLKYADATGAQQESDFDEFWSLCSSGEGPYLCQKIDAWVRSFAQEASAGGKILAARDQPYDLDDAIEECRIRMLGVWKALI